jgi:hypothetical protein
MQKEGKLYSEIANKFLDDERKKATIGGWLN